MVFYSTIYDLIKADSPGRRRHGAFMVSPESLRASTVPLGAKNSLALRGAYNLQPVSANIPVIERL